MLPLTRQNTFIYLISRGTIGLMVEKAAAAAAGAGDRKGGKRRTGKPETFLLACHHQQTVPSSTAEAHHLSGHGSACFNPRFGEAEVVGMGQWGLFWLIVQGHSPSIQ